MNGVRSTGRSTAPAARSRSAAEAGGALTGDEAALRTGLVFGLIEGVILVHLSGPERPVEAFAAAEADAALRIVGVTWTAGGIGAIGGAGTAGVTGTAGAPPA